MPLPYQFLCMEMTYLGVEIIMNENNVNKVRRRHVSGWLLKNKSNYNGIYRGRLTPSLTLPLAGGGNLAPLQRPSLLRERVGVRVKTNLCMVANKKYLMALLILLLLSTMISCRQAETLDAQLRQIIEAEGIEPIALETQPDPALIALGQALFFDKELSGNRDIACATCHHPTQGSGDGLAVSIGTGGEGLGPQREIGYGRSFIPRNAPEIFNRGSAEWVTMFWDSRVFKEGDYFHTPAGDALPGGLDSILAAQAMFPVTSGDEMRGASGDNDIYGNLNELAQIPEEDFTAIWAGLMRRLLEYPVYEGMFAQAYPEIPPEELGFQHAANAIAAFEIQAYTLPGSPWSHYLDGDLSALTDAQKKGALLFFGEANCSTCHSGTLLTDQAHHTLAVPQVGPGKGEQSPLDLGRWRVSGVMDEMYAFRTPSLHNVAVSSPYMHDGAFLSLEASVLHHLNPETSLRTYDPAQHLVTKIHDTFQNDPALIEDMLSYVAPELALERELTTQEIDNLIAFLHALTDPTVFSLEKYIPLTVPSGLPVADRLGQQAN